MNISFVKVQHSLYSPVTGPEGSTWLRPADRQHMKMVRLSALRTSHLYFPGNIAGTHFLRLLQWPRGLRRSSAVARLLRLWV